MPKKAKGNVAKSNENSSLLFGQSLRKALEGIAEKLGTDDQKRLDNLLSASKSKEIRLDVALQATFPGHANPLPVFNNFQLRFNKLAQTNNNPVRLRKDNKKRDEPIDRTCWFIGPDPVVAKVTQFNQSNAQATPNSVYIPPDGLVSSSDAERRQPVRFFVSYAHGDGHRHESELADSLIAFLKKHLALSKRYEFKLWTDRGIPLGSGWFQQIQNAIDECDFGLLLVSPAFFGSEFILKHELAHFLPDKSQPSRKPVIPVGLIKFGLDKELKGLGASQIYLGPNYQHTQSKPLFFDSVRGDPAKNQYALDLSTEMETSLDHWFAKQKTSSTTMIAVANQVTFEQDRDGECLVTETVAIQKRLAHLNATRKFPGYPDNFEPNYGAHGVLADREGMTPDAVDADRRQPAYSVLKSWAADRNPTASPFFALLGEYGIGKSTTLQHFTCELTKEREADPSLPLPIYIDLRAYVSNHELKEEYIPTIEELLDSIIARSWKVTDRSITSAQIVKMVREEGAVILFDGLDERTVHLSIKRAQDFIRTLWSILPDATQSAKPGIQRGKMLISCRTHYFGDVASQNAMLSGESREQIDRKTFPILYLLPFTEEQIESYLGKALGSKERADAAMVLIRKIHNLSDLVPRPYLLSLITTKIGELERLSASGQTVNSARLYELFIKDWLTRDTGKHQIGPDHKRRLMSALAAALWVSGDKSWSVSRLENWFDQFLYDNPVIASAYANLPREVLKEDLRTATFVLRPDTEDEDFRFAHTSLQEFFLALHLLQSLMDGQVKNWDIPMPSLETFAFVGELLQLHPSQSAIETLERLLGGEAGTNAGRNALGYWLQAIAIDFAQPKPKRLVLPDVDLEGWQLVGTNDRPLVMRNADLRRAKLNRCRIEHVIWDGANLEDAQLRNAVLIDVRAERARLVGADLSGVRWRGGSLRAAVVVDQDMVNNDLRLLAGCQFLYVDMTNAQMPNHWTTVASAVSKQGCEMTQAPPQSFTATTAHSRYVSSVAFSPNGQLILSGSDDNSLRLWNAHTGESLRTFEGHSSDVLSVAFSPNGELILSGSDDNSLRLWDALSGECLRTFHGHSRYVGSVAFSPDGELILSGSYDNSLRLWDAHSGECLRTFEGHSNSVESVAFSPNGEHILSGSDDNSLRLWDAHSGECLRTFEGHSSDVLSVAFSPNGELILSGSDDNSLRLWDAHTGECLRTFDGHSSSVSSVAFSPNGEQILSGSYDNSLRLWEVQTGECLRTFHGHTSYVWSVGISPNGEHILSGSYDNSLRLWDLQTGECLRTFQGHLSSVTSVAFSPNGEFILSGSDDKSLRLWDAHTSECLRTIQGHSSSVGSVAFSPNGQLILSGASDNSPRLWDAHTGECLRTFQGHSSSIWSVAFSLNGEHILSGSKDKSLRLWDAHSGECLRIFHGHSSSVSSVAFSPNGELILSGSSDNSLRLWDAHRDECLRTFEGHSRYVRSVAFSPNGEHILSGSYDNSLRLWDVHSGECLRTFQGHARSVSSVAFSPNGELILSGSWDNSLKLWDAHTGECLRTFQGHASSVSSVAFSPNGEQILSGYWINSLQLWDATTGEMIRKAVLLPDGSWVVTDAEDKIIAVGGEAWRFLGWRWTDPTTKRQRILPLEAFGPVPWSQIPK
jgi:WD40 repeat protein